MPTNTNEDIFGKPQFALTHPITADQIYILWGGQEITEATNVQIQYQQQVSRRYTLSSQMNQAAIIPGRPVGTMAIGRLYVSNQQDIFALPGWNVCEDPTTLDLHFKIPGNAFGSKCITTQGKYQVKGAYVTGFSFQGNADDLQVIDNISIEFLQLAQSGWTNRSGASATV